MGKLVDTVRALAEPVAAEYGCEVWDVEYIREAGGVVPARLYRQAGRSRD